MYLSAFCVLLTKISKEISEEIDVFVEVRYPSSFSLQARQASTCLRVEVMFASRAVSFWLLGSVVLKLNFGILKRRRKKA